MFAVEAAGGKALPCVVDIRDEKQVQDAIDQAVKKVKIFIRIKIKPPSFITLVTKAKSQSGVWDSSANVIHWKPETLIHI